MWAITHACRLVSWIYLCTLCLFISKGHIHKVFYPLLALQHPDFSSDSSHVCRESSRTLWEGLQKGCYNTKILCECLFDLKTSVKTCKSESKMRVSAAQPWHRVNSNGCVLSGQQSFKQHILKTHMSTACVYPPPPPFKPWAQEGLVSRVLRYSRGSPSDPYSWQPWLSSSPAWSAPGYPRRRTWYSPSSRSMAASGTLLE